MHRCPYRHIQQEQYGDGQVRGQECIGHNKKPGDAQDKAQCLMLRHSQGDEFMVDMILVGEEQRLMVAQAVKHYPNYVQHRHQQERESRHDGTGKEFFLGGIGHTEMDGHYSQQQTDSQ